MLKTYLGLGLDLDLCCYKILDPIRCDHFPSLQDVQSVDSYFVAAVFAQQQGNYRYH